MAKPSAKVMKMAEEFAYQLAGWSEITVRPLFGAAALIRNDRVFAMIWKGSLYFKVDDRSREDFNAAGSQSLGYISQGQKRALKSFLESPADVLENDEKLHAWAERAYQAALRSLDN